MKNSILCAALILCTGVMAKVEVSGVITPTIKSGAATASDPHTMNIEMADAQLNVDAQINDNLSGSIILYADQEALDDASAYSLIDEAYLTQKLGDASLKFGRSYLAFGLRETNFISDPETLTFGEIQTNVAEISYQKWGFSGTAYTFASSAWENGDKEGLNSYGATLTYENDNLTMGVSYISNMANSSILGDTITTVGDTFNKMPAAYSVFAKLSTMGFSLIAEYMSALKAFDKSEYTYTRDGIDREATPSTLNVEMAYSKAIMGKEATLAIGYQSNFDIATTDKTLAPTQIILAGATLTVNEGANLSLEYRQATDAKISKGGATDGHTAHMTTLAYSIEF